MKRIYLLLGLLAFLFNCNAQNMEIFYHFPQPVLEHIQNYISNEGKKDEYYFADIDTRGDTVELLLRSIEIHPGIDTFSVYQLVKSSNRYLQLDSQKLPLIFFDDLLYSNLTNKKIGEGRFKMITLGGSGGLYMKFRGKPWTEYEILEIDY